MNCKAKINAGFPRVCCEQGLEGSGFYESNPIYTDVQSQLQDWVFSSPSAQSLDGELIDRAAAHLQALSYMNSFLVIRNNAIVAEHYFNGSKANHSNNVHSVSKSILGALVGKAIALGYLKGLDQPLHEVLPEYFKDINNPQKKRITIGHLLTLSAGFAWEEDATEFEIETQKDWVTAILSLPQVHVPGEKFNYSTGQTHLLSVIIQKASGMSLCEFAHQYLFKPMQITPEHWGRDPQGYFSGGFNLYLTPRELAKFGLLYLNAGQWENQQLLPKAWVTESLQPQMEAEDGYTYGRLWWLTKIKNHPVAIAWGWGGQLLYVIKDLNLLVVFTTNTANFKPDFDGYDIISNSIIPAAQEIK